MKCFPDSGFIMERVTMRKFILIFYGIFGCVAMIFASFLLFVTDRYRADDMLIADLTAGDTAVSQSSEAEGVTVFSPQEGSDWGFIFYPGAMVESNAYSPLLTKMALLEVIVQRNMPLQIMISWRALYCWLHIQKRISAAAD